MSRGRRQNGKRQSPRRSKQYFGPPLAPRQAQRLRYLYLVNSFTAALWLHWQSLNDAAGTIEMMLDLGRSVISQELAAAILDECVSGKNGDGESQNAAILFAATKWVLELDLSHELVVS